MSKFIKIIVFFLLVVNNAGAQRISVRFFDQSTGKKLYSTHARDSAQAIERIEVFVNHLRDKGYLEASADSLSYSPGQVSVLVHTGEKYFIDTLIIVNGGDTVIYSWRRKIFSPDYLDNALSAEVSKLRNNGYPFARIGGKYCRLTDRHFSCLAEVDRRDFYVWDTLKIVDCVRVSRRFLQNYLSLRPGKPFSMHDFEQIQSNLSHLDFLTMTGKPQIEFYPGLARPVLSLSRRKVNSAGAMLGIRYENGTLTTIGHLNLHLKALVHAEDFTLSWDRPRTGWQQLKTQLQVPYLWGLPVGVEMELFSQKIDTTQLNLSLSGGLSYYFHRLDYIALSWQSENNLTAMSSQSERSVRKRLINTAFLIDSRNNSLIPMRGFLVKGSVGYGRKNVADSVSWSMNYAVGIEKFTRVRENITVLTRLQSKAMISPRIFDNEVMHVGGYADFRGFGEQELRATSYYLLTIEPRLRTGSSYFLFFVEKGMVKVQTITTDEAVHTLSAGLGINLRLQSAILNLTYAIGMTGNNFTDHTSKIHLSYRLVF